MDMADGFSMILLSICKFSDVSFLSFSNDAFLRVGVSLSVILCMGAPLYDILISLVSNLSFSFLIVDACSSDCTTAFLIFV